MIEINEYQMGHGGRTTVRATPLDLNDLDVGFGSYGPSDDRRECAHVRVGEDDHAITLHSADPNLIAALKEIIATTDWAELSRYCWDRIARRLDGDQLRRLVNNAIFQGRKEGLRAARREMRRALGINQEQ